MDLHEVRRMAKRNVVALLMANAEAGEGDLWVGTEDFGEAEVARFADEVTRLASAISRTLPTPTEGA